MNLNKPELLCPVGGILQLKAAVQNGADAVYMGGLNYNARMYADNFTTISELEEAVDYAHLRNVKVYITLNTLLNDNELEEAVSYAEKLYEIGVDAVIVQDLGLIDMLSKKVPKLKVHVSTQSTIYSVDGVNFFDKHSNVERVVLARELSLNEITQIVNNVNKEIEIFVHGALCVCYSGQCKLSSQIGARSGNRGRCAQPCRLPYKIEEVMQDENYYLSTKDVCLIDILPDVLKTGVHSLKIEGRMKSPEYVAAVTRIYRKYIDMYYENKEYVVDKEDKEVLLQVFNRGGFSTGYLENSNSKNIWCNARPKNSGIYIGNVQKYDSKKGNITIKLEKDLANGDVIEVVNKELSSSMVSYIRTSGSIVKKVDVGKVAIIGDIKGKIEVGNPVYKIISKELNDKLKESFETREIKKNKVECEIFLNISKVPKIILKCEVLGKRFEVEIEDGNKCEVGQNKYLTDEVICSSLSKTGDVPFEIDNINIVKDDKAFTTMANLNSIRRKAFEALSNKIVRNFKNTKEKLENINEGEDLVKVENRDVDTKISAYVYRLKLLKDMSVLKQFDRVYISLEDVVRNKEEILNLGINSKICLYLPTITNSRYRKYMCEELAKIKEFENILITNVEHLEFFKDKKYNLYLDNSFNVFNSYTLKTLEENGILGINLSNELSLQQIENIQATKSSKLEVDVYGNLQAMYSDFCVLKATGNCGFCKNIKYNLVDRKGKKFPCLFNNIGCTMQVLNADKLFSKEAIIRLAGKVEYMRLYVYDETKEELEDIVTNIKQIVSGNDNLTNDITSNDKVKYTNGHFFREV